jgi:hypothetical protein
MVSRFGMELDFDWAEYGRQLEDKKRAELEACDQGAIQGKRIRVLLKATLPKPES